MYDTDKRKQNRAKSTKKKNVSWLHLEKQIARWIEWHNDMVINGKLGLDSFVVLKSS